jgi:pSer/pThr/pTyr-binding forkhead associated (FHA) protein
MGWSLTVVQGPGTGQRMPIERDELIVGRREGGCDLALDAPGISRRHLQLRLLDGTLTAEDLGSRNGSTKGGEALTGSVPLVAGDLLGVGSCLLLVSDDRHLGQPRLLVTAGPDAGREAAIGDEGLLVGRDPTCTLCLSDKGVSRKGCRIRARGTGFLVEDEGSSNPVRLAGQPVSGPTALRSGDELRLGSSSLLFIDGRIEDLVGRSLGGCALLERRGRGSASVVYRARSRDLGQDVAIKVLDPGLAGDRPSRGRRLNAVRNFARNLEHPRLQPLLSADHADELLYVMAPWSANGSAADLLESANPPVVVAALALDAALGLAAAAAAGHPHPALRPGDLLIDAEGQVRVDDLALAEPWRAERPDEGPAPLYAAPEELEGAPADALSNQFSLAAICWHLLTGEAPWEDADARQLAQQRRQAHNTTPALRATRDLPAPLAACLTRMLHQDPARRFRDWSGVIGELERIVAHGARAADAVVKAADEPHVADGGTKRTPAPQRPAPEVVAVADPGAATDHADARGHGPAARQRSSAAGILGPLLIIVLLLAVIVVLVMSSP